MTEELYFDPEKDEFAVVRRIVPGRLLYVETEPDKTYAFKLDKVVIRKSDGFLQPYRGEPLADLGIKVGKRVTICGLDQDQSEPTLVVDAGADTGTFSRLGSSSFDVLTGAIDYLKHR